MFEDVEAKLKRGNKILFSKDSACLRDLLGRIAALGHRTLVLWSLDCAQKPLRRFEAKYANENRPRSALEKCESWARGQLKMPEAKRAILDAHAAAKNLDDPVYEALCHAVGQAGSTVHVKTHAPGLVFYELTAIVLGNRENYQDEVRMRIGEYSERLDFWQERVKTLDVPWAGFLLE